jgi:hypothetical protein
LRVTHGLIKTKQVPPTVAFYLLDWKHAIISRKEPKILSEKWLLPMSVHLTNMVIANTKKLVENSM